MDGDKSNSYPETKQRFGYVAIPRGGRMPAREFGYGSILTNQSLPIVVLDGEVLLDTVERSQVGCGQGADLTRG